MIETINCSRCGNEISIDHALTLKLEKKFADDLKSKTLDLEKEFKEREEKILLNETSKLKEKISKEFEDRISLLSKESDEAKKELTSLKTTKIENEQLKRRLNQQKTDLELEFQQRLTSEAAEIEKKINENSELKTRTLQDMIESMKGQIEQLKRKSDSNSLSAQLVGKSEEGLILDILCELFSKTNDSFSSVARGQKGGDIIHKIKNHLAKEIGVIIYEIKNTKQFSEAWIQKAKEDGAAVNAHIVVIVSEAMPDNSEAGIYQRQGVWITSFKYLKWLAIILRESVLRINEAYSTQINREEKSQRLFDFLMSNDFKTMLNNIVSGFESIQQGHLKEKKMLDRIFKSREKDLERILQSTNGFIGCLQNISQSDFSDIAETLQLSEGEV